MEVEYMNDDVCWRSLEERWKIMRAWAVANLKESTAGSAEIEWFIKELY